MVARTRNNGTMTEAAYFGKIRSVLRQGFRYWKPLRQCKADARREYTGDNKRQKWEYQCNDCKEWFTGKQVQVDHITPVGSLRSLDDLPAFVYRLTVEEGYQILCKLISLTQTKKTIMDSKRQIATRDHLAIMPCLLWISSISMFITR